MPDRISTQIREKFVSEIVAASTLAGSRVYPSRVYPYDQLPAIGVFTRDDRWLRTDDTVGGVTEREVAVVTQLRVKANSDFDQIADELFGQIEARLMANPTLDGLVSEVLPPDATFEPAVQEKPLMAAEITWPVRYAILASSPWSPAT